MYQILKNFNTFVFQEDLLTWYDENKRDLPWRKDSDPYKVWVSEIMLQQTKVDTVIPYFYRFMEKFPDVYALAEADEQEVLKAWEGLGYYSRAKNLQSAVKEVVATYDGKVPDNPEELESLKGVGPYTKGAILSIAYDQPEPAVDGNVLRVFSRIFQIEEDITKGKTKKEIETIVREVISREDPSSFNQAIMDLGATICTPKSPACLLCPVNEHCRAFQNGVQEDLPIKKKAKKQKILSYAALLIQVDEDKYIIEKRPSTGLLADLWQFPMMPLTKTGMGYLEKDYYKEYGLPVRINDKKGDIKHVFSHLIWEIEVFEAEFVEEVFNLDPRLRVVTTEEIEDYPFPVSHQKMKRYIEG